MMLGIVASAALIKRSSGGSTGGGAISKTFTLRGPDGLTQRNSGGADDGSLALPAVGFPIMIGGSDQQASIFVGSNSYITFGGGSNAYAGLSGSNPSLPKLLIAAGDRAWITIHSGLVDNGSAYLVRFVGSTSSSISQNVNLQMTWEVTFYRDGTIGLVTGALNAPSNPVTGLASASSYYVSFNLAYDSGYLLTPGDLAGNSWIVEKKAG